MLKQPSAMNAAEKLMRLAELERAERLLLPTEASQSERVRIAAERAAIIAAVPLPPLHLMGEWRAGPWSAAFAAQFPSVDADDVLAWFANAINAGTRTAYEEGEQAGMQRRQAHEAEKLQALAQQCDKLAGALETIRTAIQDGHVRSGVNLTNLETGKSRSLGEYVAEALQAAGR